MHDLSIVVASASKQSSASLSLPAQVDRARLDGGIFDLVFKATVLRSMQGSAALKRFGNAVLE